MCFLQKFGRFLKKCKKVPARVGFELATFGSTQNLNSQNPLRHGVAEIFLSLMEMDYTLKKMGMGVVYPMKICGVNMG